MVRSSDTRIPTGDNIDVNRQGIASGFRYQMSRAPKPRPATVYPPLGRGRLGSSPRGLWKSCQLASLCWGHLHTLLFPSWHHSQLGGLHPSSQSWFLQCGGLLLQGFWTDIRPLFLCVVLSLISYHLQGDGIPLFPSGNCNHGAPVVMTVGRLCPTS